ncbi:Transcription initiation factor TFIID subunit 6 [Nymphon striatum]|nr:Transcription initiation factor TFIID subunit 6 [Nymphon striatum]
MMSSKAKSGSCVSPESIKVISESIGITNLGDDGAKDLGEDATYRLKELIQESFKFMQHGKRRKITTDDFDRAIKLKNIEPVYGFQNLEFIPFRFTSGGGRELYFNEEKEIDLNEFVNSSMPKLPLEPTLKAHWLSIEGIQPTVPENPPPIKSESYYIKRCTAVLAYNKIVVLRLAPPVSKDQQKNESIDPLSALKRTPGNKVLQVGGKNKAGKSNVPSGPTKHIETEALQSLSSDPGLHQMLPRLCTFVAEGVSQSQCCSNNLALLIYLMRMVKALLENQTLYLEKYDATIQCITIMGKKKDGCDSKTTQKSQVQRFSPKQQGRKVTHSDTDSNNNSQNAPGVSKKASAFWTLEENFVVKTKPESFYAVSPDMKL